MILHPSHPLRGLPSQAEVWRLIAFFGVGHLPRLPLSDQAVYDRLEQGGFDVRLQQWRRLDVLLDATANCKVHARAMLSGLAPGTLILFDRGYFSFPWLDDLSQQGYWYLSRTVGKTGYQILHIQAPVVPLQEVSYPPPELIKPRKAHYAHRKCTSRYATQS